MGLDSQCVKKKSEERVRKKEHYLPGRGGTQIEESSPKLVVRRGL